jgi:lipopolysaccharide export system protein LptC
VWPDVRTASFLPLPLIATAMADAGRGDPRRPDDAASFGAPAPEPERPPPFGSGGRRLRIATLKVALPAVAFAVLFLVIAWPALWPGMERLRLRGAIPVADLRDGVDAMLDTTFTGLDRRGRPFVVRSEIVHNVGNEEEPMTLAAPQGELTVDLNGDVTLVHPSGYEMRTSIARIDLPTGDASGNEPVHAEGRLGTIDAEGFHVTQDGGVINFTGKSRMTITSEHRSPR